jgi:hypothetical protein
MINHVDPPELENIDHECPNQTWDDGPRGCAGTREERSQSEMPPYSVSVLDPDFCHITRKRALLLVF